MCVGLDSVFNRCAFVIVVNGRIHENDVHVLLRRIHVMATHTRQHIEENKPRTELTHRVHAARLRSEVPDHPGDPCSGRSSTPYHPTALGSAFLRAVRKRSSSHPGSPNQACYYACLGPCDRMPSGLPSVGMSFGKGFIVK